MSLYTSSADAGGVSAFSIDNFELKVATGTPYTLTETPALCAFGTVSPTHTFTNSSSTSKHWVSATALIKYEGATFASSQNVTLKLRRTNNTAADVASSAEVFPTEVVTTKTGILALYKVDVPYNGSGAGDVLELWGSINTLPTAGSVTVISARIALLRLK